jgi:hypothetical protein
MATTRSVALKWDFENGPLTGQYFLHADDVDFDGDGYDDNGVEDYLVARGTVVIFQTSCTCVLCTGSEGTGRD